ncbi:hypothetical protein ACWCW7_21460 [Nocardia tengchongensis]
MTSELHEVRHLLAADDVSGAARRLRSIADTLPVREMAMITAELADHAELDKLAQAARAAADVPDHPDAWTLFGYECIEYGVPFAAIPALREALRTGTTKPNLALSELVYAFEDEHRHAEAVEALLAHESILRPYPERYLLTYDSILAGDLDRARTEFARLPAPENQDWLPARDRAHRMLLRADRTAPVSPLDGADLRGWHYTLTGGYLATLSPYGFDAGMTGRWAYLGDQLELCRHTLDRLGVILRAAGRTPSSVSLLPDRSDRILGMAAAELLGLPMVEYAPDRTDTLVVAYALGDLDPDLSRTLTTRATGQILFEHATYWVRPPAIAADISGLLCQLAVEPWGPHTRLGDNGPETVPADSRPESEIAREIVRADGAPDSGDDRTPPDPDHVLADFVAATRDTWLLGSRTPVNSPGPVRSSFFG